MASPWPTDPHAIAEAALDEHANRFLAGAKKCRPLSEVLFETGAKASAPGVPALRGRATARQWFVPLAMALLLSIGALAGWSARGALLSPTEKTHARR